MCFNHYVIQDKSLPSILFAKKDDKILSKL